MTNRLLLRKQHLKLDSKKIIFWKEKKAIIMSDLHLGKSAHFRKNGIATPSDIIQSDLKRISELIKKYNPLQIIVVGDLFHSKINPEWEIFKEWRTKFKELEFHLIKGNHDINYINYFNEVDIKIYDEKLIIEPFLFVHIPIKKEELLSSDKDLFVFSGHIHPGVSLIGKAKQKIILPCFLISDNQGILPAFGRLTGLYKIKPNQNDKIFIIYDDLVILK